VRRGIAAVRLRRLPRSIQRRRTKSGVLTALAALMMACGESPAPASPTAPTTSLSEGAAYLNAMMDIMQAHSVNRKTINWTNVRSQVLAAAPAGAHIGNTYPAITVALGLLGDNHSSYTSAGGAVLYVSNLSCSAPTITTVPTAGPDVGYVRVSAFSGTSAQALAFADAIQMAIRTADSGQVRGWIVDLRGNGGGNMWPMIAGIGPILGAGIAGYFTDPDAAIAWWGYNGTASQINGTVAQIASAPYTLLSANPKVAVLIDQRVASSGEAVAVAFKQRPNTRFFGTATCGLSTANQGFPMSDGALLNLTVSTMADRTSQVYGGPLQPDEVITDPATVVPAAVAWLRANTRSSDRVSVNASRLSGRWSAAPSPAVRRHLR
jgi:carboxyl-terminal processing protease